MNTGVVASLPNGSRVTITCHARGDAVEGIGGVTDIWNRLPDGGWGTDGYLETGSKVPVAPACSGGGFKLPYPVGSAHTIPQTPGSGFSHDDYNRHVVDFGMPTGTPVVASAGGTVYFDRWTNGGGIMVLIDHGDNRCSQYAHLNSTIINAGDRVAQAQQIGTPGATGTVTGPHLHWNIVYCDPTGTAPVGQNS